MRDTLGETGVGIDRFAAVLAALGTVQGDRSDVRRDGEAAVVTQQGWPWVNEMVALVRRHPRLHLDTSAHRAKYLGQPGSGWEMLMQFGNTLIQDKVLVGLSAHLVGQPHETLIQEYLSLPLKDSVKEKWLYRNAARVFRLE